MAASVSTVPLPAAGGPLRGSLQRRRQESDNRQTYWLFIEAMNTLYRDWQRRNPRVLRDSALNGADYVDEVIMEVDGEVRLKEVTGLSKALFDQFVKEVLLTGAVTDGNCISAVEQSAIYLAMMHGGLSSRQAQERFQHSGATITQVFRRFTNACNSMRHDWITGEDVHLFCTSCLYPHSSHIMGVLSSVSHHVCPLICVTSCLYPLICVTSCL